MTLERFTNDKEIAELGEDIMAILMTVKDFGIDSDTFSFAVKSLVMKMFIYLANKKDLTPAGREETKQYAYGFIQSLLVKAVGLNVNSEKDIFMVEYMNANKDKLLNDALEALNTPTNNSNNLTIN